MEVVCKMILDDIAGKMAVEIILCACDTCGKHFHRTLKIIRSCAKQHNRMLCRSCAARQSVKPQNQKEYWTAEKKAKHGLAVRGSAKYYLSLETRNLVNGMRGKKHTQETKKKMSVSQRKTWRFGRNAPAWKDGRTRLTTRVKGYCHTTFNWYYRVYERDGFKCVNCGAGQSRSNKLDAHHINPITVIIKQLLMDSNVNFCNDDERLIWLVQQPEIIDAQLKNGIALCRKCHKNAHRRWGSHFAESK